MKTGYHYHRALSLTAELNGTGPAAEQDKQWAEGVHGASEGSRDWKWFVGCSSRKALGRPAMEYCGGQARGALGRPAREYTPDPYIFFDPGGATTPEMGFFRCLGGCAPPGFLISRRSGGLQKGG